MPDSPHLADLFEHMASEQCGFVRGELFCNSIGGEDPPQDPLTSYPADRCVARYIMGQLEYQSTTTKYYFPLTLKSFADSFWKGVVVKNSDILKNGFFSKFERSFLVYKPLFIEKF